MAANKKRHQFIHLPGIFLSLVLSVSSHVYIFVKHKLLTARHQTGANAEKRITDPQSGEHGRIQRGPTAIGI
jgi:hypothetical protein